jgi:hypothetical protein
VLFPSRLDVAANEASTLGDAPRCCVALLDLGVDLKESYLADRPLRE